ncbi:hypothetical protein [Mesorhizobium captivum]|uniref:hypothetical protein n=1 Tax=Mesorhizobium captivum TaxID=3072319 RepID=UPI002A23FD4F|nr:hypothetical protein [Mesorhizobium sp. VK3C]MDX8449152.1 hypothetical protein [Mesorhizobium sp. VK3C]
MSREIEPYDPLVVSITGIEGGGAYNVIAAEVRLKGTIRSGHEATRQHAWKRPTSDSRRRGFKPQRQCGGGPEAWRTTGH